MNWSFSSMNQSSKAQNLDSTHKAHVEIRFEVELWRHLVKYTSMSCCSRSLMNSRVIMDLLFDFRCKVA